jgi:hypothetical protein
MKKGSLEAGIQSEGKQPSPRVPTVQHKMLKLTYLGLLMLKGKH